jgi:membrane-associated phospholipid phosphatase
MPTIRGYAPAMPADAETHRVQSRLRRASVDSRELAGRAWARRRDPRFQAQVALATVFALALGAFLHVVEDYLDNDPIVRWDVEFSRWLYIHTNGTLHGLFSVVTWAGNVAFLALVVVVAVAWLLRRGRVNEAALVALSAVGIELLNGGLKLLFHRPRPELAYVHLDTYSFPSGHAAGTAAIYGVLFYVVASSFRSVRARVAMALGYVVLVAVVGFSRLYLEAHYLSDVLAGASLGAAWAAGSLFVFEVKRDGDIRRHLPSPVLRALARVRAA